MNPLGQLVNAPRPSCLAKYGPYLLKQHGEPFSEAVFLGTMPQQDRPATIASTLMATSGLF